MYRFADPVSRGNFFYDGEFYVQFPDSNERFTREDSCSLYKFLTCASFNGSGPANSGKAPESPSHKDRPTKFYLAQLTHYVAEREYEARRRKEVGQSSKKLSDKALRDAVNNMPDSDLRKIVGKAVITIPEMREAVEVHILKTQKASQKANKANTAAQSSGSTGNFQDEHMNISVSSILPPGMGVCV
ncbi:hypothetical protein GYMLUDRAFT_236473 [Collybiopsis luxurians FD-317 M1]|nr:hypothetical protein GYMLUDRAFT_236473 [Collybiopsis luxurians FD-317 M1]